MYKNNYSKNVFPQSNIVISKNKIEVKLEENALWLSQKQIAELFDKNIRTINEHINNIYDNKELYKYSTIRKNQIVQKERKRLITRQIDFYNLDIIISVRYRVNSKNWTLFRIWATIVLRKDLVDGYTINEKRLQESQSKYYKLQNVLLSLSNNINRFEDISKESKGVIQILTNYSKVLDVLDKYDHQNLEKPKGMKREKYKLTYKKAKEIVNVIKSQFPDSTLIVHEREHGFESTINDIYQTFGRGYIYPTVQEKADNLLYLITKNHSSSDGNKRITTTLFITYLKENNLLFNKSDINYGKDNL